LINKRQTGEAWDRKKPSIQRVKDIPISSRVPYYKGGGGGENRGMKDQRARGSKKRGLGKSKLRRKGYQTSHC